MKQSNRLTEAALLIAVYTIILLFFMFVPLIGPLAIIFLPIPFIMYTKKYGIKHGSIMVLASIPISVIFTTIIGIPITLFVGIGGVMIGHAMYKRLKVYEIWSQGSIGFFIGLFILFIFAQTVLNVNIYEQFQEAQEDTLKMTESVTKNLGLDEEASKIAKEQMTEQFDMIIDLLPTMLAIMAIILAFLTQWMTYKVHNRLEKEKEGFPPFYTFNLPKPFIYVYLVPLVLSFFVPSEGLLGVIIFNMVTLGGLVLFVQGLSFIFYYAHWKNASRAMPIIIIILTALFPVFLMFILRILGIIDLVLSLKQKLKEANK